MIYRQIIARLEASGKKYLEEDVVEEDLWTTGVDKWK